MSISRDNLRWSSAGTVFRVALACLIVAMTIGCLHVRQTEQECPAGCDAQECLPGDCDACFGFEIHHYSRCIDEYLATHEADRRAKRSMRQCYSVRPNVDFRAGYRQAFVDVSLGADGTVPAVPPERYWYTGYRTATGRQEVENWFKGYVAGAGQATAHCRYQFNRVASSGVTALVDEDAKANGLMQTQGDSYSPWGPEIDPSR